MNTDPRPSPLCVNCEAFYVTVLEEQRVREPERSCAAAARPAARRLRSGSPTVTVPGANRDGRLSEILRRRERARDRVLERESERVLERERERGGRFMEEGRARRSGQEEEGEQEQEQEEEEEES